MNKTLALDPKAIKSALDWYKVYPSLGQRNGMFLANYPKKWVLDFLSSLESTDMSEWGFWDLEKLKAHFIDLDRQLALVSLQSPYDRDRSWFQNFCSIPEERRRNCIPFGARDDPNNPPTLDSLDPTDLRVETTISGTLHPRELVRHLSPFLMRSEIVAIVDRYAELENSVGNPSQFSTFLKCLVEELQGEGSRCHEVLVYAQSPKDRDYQSSVERLQDQLGKLLSGLKSPSHGVHYICCDEIDQRGKTDLHARKIVTKYVAFSLADSIGGRSHSKSITRIPDSAFLEENIKNWIDGDHGLTIKLKASWKNS